MTYIARFILGAIFGSFLNVVALRWAERPVTGRSACSHCGHTLVWFELVPIASFFALRRRCLHCDKKISWRYPIVEILTGLVFVTLPNPFVLTVFCIYLIIALYDLDHKIIPNKLVYLTIALALGFRLLEFGVWDFAAGPIVFLFFALIWLITRGRAIGFGDAKLGLSVGWLLGAAEGFSATIMAFWAGAAILIPLLAYRKQLKMGKEIPFAPFIVLGAWLAAVFHPDLLHVLK